MRYRRPNWRRIGASVLGAGLLGFGALNWLAYNHAYAMTHFSTDGARTDAPEELTLLEKGMILITGINLPRPNDPGNKSDLSAACETAHVTTEDDIELEMWICHDGTIRPLSILFHGYGGAKISLVHEANLLMQLGHNVVLVDFRGSGGSSESYTTVGVREADDVAAVVRYAASELPSSHLILYGHSMGAASILRAVAVHDLEPDALIIEAVFDTMLNTVRNRFDAMGVPSFPSAEALVFWGGRQWGFDGFAHNPVDYAAEVTVPTLIMHGETDPRAQLSEGTAVYNALNGPKTMFIFEEIGHEGYAVDDPELWESQVSLFLEENLQR